MPGGVVLAVFFTPAIVSGTAKMQHGQFVLWNLLASFAFSAVGGRQLVRVGQDLHRPPLGLATSARCSSVSLVGALVTVLFVRHRRRSASGSAPS